MHTSFIVINDVSIQSSISSVRESFLISKKKIFSSRILHGINPNININLNWDVNRQTDTSK